MEQALPQTIALLTHTPAALNALLRNLPDAWTSPNEGENTWSAFQVIAHMVQAERGDWMPRAKTILQLGETQTFQPFDRTAHLRESQGKKLPQLLDEFAHLRSENLSELHSLNLQPEQLALRGRHPALGVVTLSSCSPLGPSTISLTCTRSQGFSPINTAKPSALGAPTSAY